MGTREVDYAAERRGAHVACAHSDAPGLATRNLSSAIALMRQRGLRVTAARRLVLEALLAADGPMSAEQIAEGIGGRVPCSDLGSVYRNLQTLQGIGLVRHVHLGHGPALHALALAGEWEYLTCERCADFRVLAPEALDAVHELIERQFGYRASFTHFPIVGLCPSCTAAVDGEPRSSAEPVSSDLSTSLAAGASTASLNQGTGRSRR